jgi:3-oxoadipate enol-lactonase
MTAGPRPNRDANAPALVFLHGFALDSRMWRRQVAALDDEYRVLTLDLPGFGPQAREVGEVSPADEVARAMDVTGLVRSHLIANAYGAAVAIDFALQHPKRVQSLSLIGPMLLGRRTGIEAWQRCVSLANEGDRATAVEVWLDDPLFEGVRNDEETFEEIRQIVLDYGGGHWTGKVASKWYDADPTPKLKSLQVPSLVVSGEGDIPSFMLMAEAYAKSLPKVRREIIQGAGHFVMIERPEELNTILRDFLKSV